MEYKITVYTGRPGAADITVDWADPGFGTPTFSGSSTFDITGATPVAILTTLDGEMDKQQAANANIGRTRKKNGTWAWVP